MFRYLTAVLAAALAFPAAASADPHLLVDDHMIVRQAGLERVITPPAQRTPLPDFTRFPDFQPHVSVIHEDGRFRMWYTKVGVDGSRGVGYTESPDGYTWQGEATPVTLPGYDVSVTVIPDPAGYRVAYYGQPGGPHGPAEDGGMYVGRSADGLVWEPLAGPMFTRRELGWDRSGGDIVSLFRHRGRYVAFVKMQSNPGEFQGLTASQVFPGYRRLTGITTSVDGVNWTPPQRLFVPDASDAGVTEFYGVAGVVERGGLLVGFLRVLRDDIGRGVGDSVLVWSRDGVTWQRDRQPFLPRGEGWDGAMSWGVSQVVVGSRTLIYYAGFEFGHKVDARTSRRLGVASMLTDRYVAREGTGTLVTRSFRHRGGSLVVNARVGGSLTATVGQARCVAPRQNRIMVRLRCDRPLRAGTSQVVFRLRDVSLYSFEVR